MTPTASQIAFSLDKGRRVREGEYLACCPAHQDKSPSLSISEKSDRTLVHCFSGCPQGDVIDALRSMGLWQEPQPRDPQRPRKLSQGDIDYMGTFVLMYRAELQQGFQATSKEHQQYARFLKRLNQGGVGL